MPVKRHSPSERSERQERLDAWRQIVREGAPCPVCHARRRERCEGDRGQLIKRNHAERERLFKRWCEEQEEAERLDRMLGRARHRG